MKQINQFTNQIVEIVKLSYDNLSSPDILRHKDNMSPEQFREEFRTVKISLQRQTGHTTAAVRLLNHFPNSLVFIPRGSMRHHFEERYLHLSNGSYPGPHVEYKSPPPGKEIKDFLHDRVWCADNDRLKRFLLDQKYLVKNKYDLVIIDNASHYRVLEKAGIYGLLQDRTKLFVELQ